MTVADAERLCDSIGDTQDEALIRLSIATGMRREDAVSVRAADIDLERGTVTYSEKKKKSRTRIVHIAGSHKLLSSLEKQLRLIPRGSVWLFPSKMGAKAHMSSRTAYNRLQYWLKRNRLESRPFHALRSTCIKIAQSRGWTPEQVSELTGDTIRVIQEHYSRPSDDEMAKVARERPIL